MQGLAASPRHLGGSLGTLPGLPEAAALNRTLLATLRTAFAHVAIVPGSWDYLVAGGSPFPEDGAGLEAVLEQRGITGSHLPSGWWREHGSGRARPSSTKR